MRKLFAGMMVCMLMLALTACGNSESNGCRCVPAYTGRALYG